MLKKITLSLMVFIVMAMAVFQADSEASGIPHAYWKLNEQYQSAINSGNHQEVISKGTEIANLFGDRKDSDALNIVTPRLQNIALSYEALGNYDSAIETWKRYIPYAKLQGWDDGVLYAEGKIKGLSFPVDLYAKTEDTSKNPYRGEKYEPVSGMIFGSFYDNDPRIGEYRWDKIQNYYPNKDSAYLLYMQWGQRIEGNHHLESTFKDAKANDIAVKLALNFDDQPEGSIGTVLYHREYLVEMAEYLNETGIPVFLRFANEMNIDEKMAGYPEDYKMAFRFVSDIMREHAPNVAMVWAPNDISATGYDYDMYYPGDEYVDWVGLSTYHFLYFQGKDDWGDLQDSIDSRFFTGDYVNPVEKIRDFVEKYGSRKPIMLAETGVGHYSKTLNRDLSDPWALVQMRRLYNYVPMVYPEVKGAFYFNRNHGNDVYDYSLYANSKVNGLYNEIVSDDYFLNNIGEKAPYRFAKVDGHITVEKDTTFMTYAIPPKVLQPKIEYRLDGRLIKASTTVPYSLDLKYLDLLGGYHSLNVRVYDEAGSLMKSKDYTVSTDDPQYLNLDHASAWARAEIVNAKELGIAQEKILSDYGRSITREEFSEMAVRMYEKLSGKTAEIPSQNPFKDTHNPYIMKAYALGITDGVSRDQFMPNQNITREQIATMFYRAIEAVDKSFVYKSGNTNFEDRDQISSWAMDSVGFMNEKGIMKGVGENSINPKANTSRQEAIALALRAYRAFE
jgi:hypothetical protein